MNVGIAIPRAVRSGTSLSSLLTPAVLAAFVFMVPVMVVPTMGIDFGSAAYAEGGNGGDGGGGNGGGGKNNKPEKGDLYGDVVYLLRDETGIPEVVNGCIRPLDAAGMVLAINADDSDSSGGIEGGEVPAGFIEGDTYNSCSLGAQSLMSVSPSSEIEIADDDGDDDEAEPCDPISNCSDYVVEVELGRLSMLRSPPSVIDKALEDAVSAIKGDVRLDWGGRLAPGGTSLDSPLVNLALMREFVVNGEVDGFNPADFADTNGLVDLDGNRIYNNVIAAAFGLGAGDDKEGMGIDTEVVNRVGESLRMGTPYYLFSDGVVNWGTPGENAEPIYIGFDIFNTHEGFDESFEYSRKTTYPGHIMYEFYNGVGWDLICEEIGFTVFGVGIDDPAAEGVKGLAGYALAANDARRVLLFVHDAALVHYVDSVFEETSFEDIETETQKSCTPEQ